MSTTTIPDEDTRHRLLNAAGRVFAARGFQNATVREICAAAEVNIASVAYYFRDKMGLYRAVVRQIRDDETRRFPIPDPISHADPTERLFAFVRALLHRMLNDAEANGWQVRLLMREVQQPTEAMEDIVKDHFSPILDQLCQNLAELGGESINPRAMTHLALSVIGQCFHYRISEHAIHELLSARDLTSSEIDIDELAVHITSVTLAATCNAAFVKQQAKLRDLIP
ncbi:putative HTH-type transcriptional regulator YttP [Rosistilla carotiformis]|uniref:Putative HTH-type transcriptional regulator YttP n=1 Tax=Rosistilla carotiformis TaxID=2528017 RepID=A0A518JZU4_9BACT|nr:CerR family C-terminal domain-containing protein [Rosistilla carotiformis]QDV71073.1 putative HTH-type transcriptional regulator YttP [Rosistilla carotiformis]